MSYSYVYLLLGADEISAGHCYAIDHVGVALILYDWHSQGYDCTDSCHVLWVELCLWWLLLQVLGFSCKKKYFMWYLW